MRRRAIKTPGKIGARIEWTARRKAKFNQAVAVWLAVSSSAGGLRWHWRVGCVRAEVDGVPFCNFAPAVSVLLGAFVDPKNISACANPFAIFRPLCSCRHGNHCVSTNHFIMRGLLC
jgi:hypothetical protein